MLKLDARIRLSVGGGARPQGAGLLGWLGLALKLLLDWWRS